MEGGSMSANRSHTGSLVAGLALVVLGLLALAGQLFRSFNFWETVWPFLVIGVGGLFFVGMFSGGKSAAGLAIPGSILSVIGFMLFLQNIFDHWQSWAYGWTVILMSVGLGIFIMGWYTENAGQRSSGLRVLKIGAILFVLFGGFFEMIFDSFGISRFLFPVALILLGSYLVFARSSVIGRRDEVSSESTDTTTN